jgi:hypothetical protein
MVRRTRAATAVSANTQGETMADLHGLIKATVANPPLPGGDNFTAAWLHT